MLNSLRTGNTTSCGCKRTASLKNRNGKHGHAQRAGRHPLYQTWANIVQRCTNPNNTKYADYGGRGILVCQAWRESFAVFLRDVGEKPSDDAEIDRIDNDAGYEPGNIRWATRKQQNRNTRTCKRYCLNGENLTITEWAFRLGWSIEGMRKRLHALPVEDALIPKVKTV